MLANHTSIRNIFKVLMDHYKKLRKRDAYMQQYKSTKVFSDSLEEFDHAEETVRRLVEEYAAAEKESYIDWGATEDMKDNNDGMDY